MIERVVSGVFKEDKKAETKECVEESHGAAQVAQEDVHPLGEEDTKDRQAEQVAKEADRREHEVAQFRAKLASEVWAGKGLGCLEDGSIPKGGDAFEHALKELAAGAARGILLGGSMRASFSLVFALMKGKVGLVQALENAVGKDTRKFAAFLGAFTGLFRLSNAVLTAWTGNDTPSNSFFAGGIAGLTLLIDERERRKMIALYLFSRSLDVLVRRSTRDGYLPYWKDFEAFMFGVSNIPIMYGFLFEPDILQKGYYEWILHMGAVTDQGLSLALRERRNALAKGEWMPLVPCSRGYHEGSCTWHCVSDWFFGLGRAGKIYVSVHLLSLAFRHKALAADPKTQLLKTFVGFIKSCMFLSTYVFFVKSSQCFLRNLRQTDDNWHAVVAGMLTGFSTYLEKPSRVSELMLYCVPRGMEATWIYLEKRNYVKSVGGFEAVFYMIAMAILTSGQRADFKPTYHNSLCFVLGSDPLHRKDHLKHPQETEH